MGSALTHEVNSHDSRRSTVLVYHSKPHRALSVERIQAFRRVNSVSFLVIPATVVSLSMTLGPLLHPSSCPCQIRSGNCTPLMSSAPQTANARHTGQEIKITPMPSAEKQRSMTLHRLRKYHITIRRYLRYCIYQVPTLIKYDDLQDHIPFQTDRTPASGDYERRIACMSTRQLSMH